MLVNRPPKGLSPANRVPVVRASLESVSIGAPSSESIIIIEEVIETHDHLALPGGSSCMERLGKEPLGSVSWLRFIPLTHVEGPFEVDDPLRYGPKVAHIAELLDAGRRLEHSREKGAVTSPPNPLKRSKEYLSHGRRSRSG